MATAESDEKFTTIAREASTAQLTRICSAYRRVLDIDSADTHEERRRRREVTVQPLDNGLVRLAALLEPDEAAIVLAALDTRIERAWRRDRPTDDATPPTELAARRADALVELATEGLLCDAAVCTVTEQLDRTFNQGRRRRTVNRRQRRSLHHRDRRCRYPGCTMRRYVDAHHVIPWENHGPTKIDNLAHRKEDPLPAGAGQSDNGALSGGPPGEASSRCGG